MILDIDIKKPDKHSFTWFFIIFSQYFVLQLYMLVVKFLFGHWLSFDSVTATIRNI